MKTDTIKNNFPKAPEQNENRRRRIGITIFIVVELLIFFGVLYLTHK